MKVDIRGMEDVQTLLDELAPKHAKALARSTVQAIAADMAKQVRNNAPKQSGQLKKSIKARRRKSQALQPRSTVNIGAWYWRFVEFGTKNEKERPFVLPVYNATLANSKTIFVEKFKKQLLKKLKKLNKTKK